MTARKATGRAAVFLDRDGTIIEDRGHLRHPSQVAFFADTVPSLQRLQRDFDLFVVTHQSGVAKGLISQKDVTLVNTYIESELAGAGVRIQATYVCPHDRNEGCHCIKPKPFFLWKAREEHGLDLRRSFVVGDHPHDVALAANAGATGIYVLTGHGMKHREELCADALCVAGIGEAVDLIVQGTEARRPDSDVSVMSGGAAAETQSEQVEDRS